MVSTTSISDAGFRGFDLYYKFYSSISAVQSGYAGSSYTYEDLLSAGFYPVCGPSDTSYSTRSHPLIAVPTTYRGTYFAIEFNFVESGATFYYVTDNSSVAVTDPTTYGAPSEMRRAPEDTVTASDTYGTAKRFNTQYTISSVSSGVNYTSSDVDFTDTSVQNVFSGSTGLYYAAFYDVSVAYDSSEGYYYSYPIYLGYVTLLNPNHG
ncbi:MAG TPA: hypothetical protein VHE79_06740 [Spirochaetia bacterium]